jgi:integrase
VTRRRSVGEGSVYEDATRGRWLGSVTLPNGQRKRVVGKNRTETRQKLDRLRRSIGLGEAPVDGNATVAQAVDLWSTRVLAARRLAPRTRERYAHHCHVLKDGLGSRRLAKLTADDIEALLDRECAEGGLSRDTLTKLRSTLVQVLDFAVRRGLAVSNPAVHATVPADAARTAARRSLKPDEARVLFDACEHEPLGPMFRLGLLVGMRPGELAGLRWGDVDLEHGTLTVGHAVQMRGGRGFHVDVLKTSASHRTIGLPAVAIAELRRQLLRTTSRKTVTTALAPRLVFPSRHGTVLEPSNVRRELTRICAAAEVPRITPNELRHTCATLLNDDGVPLELIADMLGHTTTTMLQRHYRHRVRPSADAAVRTMDLMFEQGNDQPASAVSRARMNSRRASAETSRREPRRNDRNSPDRKKR